MDEMRLADGAASAIPRGWYHVINRGHQRRAIFRDRRCYEDFLTRLQQFPERFGVKIHSYVLMPNHDHLQLSLGARGGLAAAMHWLNTGYGIWFNRRYRRQGALFQGRYKAILFDPDECLLAIHYYIHLNPVRVGALKAAEIEEHGLSSRARSTNSARSIRIGLARRTCCRNVDGKRRGCWTLEEVVSKTSKRRFKGRD